ncbi:putative galactose oxidase/kelch, beta-propeller, F-box associated interaction [Medicago truncatula]|uniref:Putative galactose oxidase/kelch, beta-propeller, F-box associated interaction n=1 Tax=Medicago truncatula TaxID=3880 RepID=A0A396GIX0_MEDTR|nr:putative galactose oxidase/kelch, beta-propeller, F-box associated interaction [Medicago truncatula]
MNMFRTNFFIPKHLEDDDETCLLVKEESRGFPVTNYLAFFPVKSLSKGDDFKVIWKVYYPLEFRSGDWVYFPDKDDPFWERDVHELDLNDSFWEEKKLIFNLYDPFSEIYSLKSNSWRKLDGVDMPASCPRSLVNMNGFCHWLSIEGPVMVLFDFTKETFVATPLPSNSDIKYKQMKMGLVELDGSLSYITNYNQTPDFHIWVLGELGVKESWTKFFVVGPLTCPLISGISVANKNRIFFNENDFVLGWFDLNTQRIEKIEAKEESSCLHIAIYKENLLSFGGIV